MSTRWTSADLASVRSRLYGPEGQLPNRKYRNQPITVAGIRFDSKLEAKRYDQLRLLQQAGEIAWFIRHPRFDLAPGVQYVADFLVVMPINPPNKRFRYGDTCYVRVEEVKGAETAMYRTKMKLMAEKYPHVRVQVLKKADFG